MGCTAVGWRPWTTGRRLGGVRGQLVGGWVILGDGTDGQGWYAPVMREEKPSVWLGITVHGVVPLTMRSPSHSASAPSAVGDQCKMERC